MISHSLGLTTITTLEAYAKPMSVADRFNSRSMRQNSRYFGTYAVIIHIGTG